jgi:hypothetical protein
MAGALVCAAGGGAVVAGAAPGNRFKVGGKVIVGRMSAAKEGREGKMLSNTKNNNAVRSPESAATLSHPPVHALLRAMCFPPPFIPPGLAPLQYRRLRLEIDTGGLARLERLSAEGKGG